MRLIAVLLVVLQWSGGLCITVPPSWQPKNAKNGHLPVISYKHPSVSTTPLSLSSDKFQFHSFFPPDAKPAENVQQLQYRLPNNQNLYVYHPQPSKGAKIETPQSYQIVNFDRPNSEQIKHIPKKVQQHLTENTPIRRQYKGENTQTRQHLTEVSPSEVNEDSSESKEQISEHEIPKDVPTRPIYPGEGQWAKYGQKHRPYIRPKTQKISQESEEQPEGYDTFEKGEQQFQKAQNNFHHDLQTFPERNNLPSSQIDDSDSSETPLYKKHDLGFVPEKLYTQVRRTENEQHLPRSAIDPEQEENADRLREVVKNSRIHTVYTEEGYEDEEYDHAGHEKNAENHEGHGQTVDDQSGAKEKGRSRNNGRYNEEHGHKRGRNHERRRLHNNKRAKNEDYNNSEAYSKKSRKTNQEPDTANSNKITSTSPTKQIKKVTTKDNIDMEIHTEIKYTPQKKKHKFVKIIPSPQNGTITSKRVKRYDIESLSKKYVRRRPQYYWKRIKTTTTKRPVVKSREKFENAFKTHHNKHEKEEMMPLSEAKSTTETSSMRMRITESSVMSTTVTTEINTTPSTTVHPDLMNPELTTKLTKPAPPKVLPVKIRKFKRVKRFTNDFPKISVDLSEFPDVNKFAEPTVKPDLTHIKYPYYNLPVSEILHEDSPLRYAENMKNIPKKVENDLSFYDSREHIKCAEIERNVNPIPEDVDEQKEGEATDKMRDMPNLPRLKGLGDKIDCLKVKYFGENPLDSPFFQEETIEDPVPFFGMKENTKKRELKIKILEPIVVLDELIESATANPIHKNSKAVLKPPYTLTEMMTMNQEKIMKLTPKNIYDQISLLEEDKTVPSADKFIIVYDNQEVTKPEIVTSTAKPQIRKRPTVSVIRKLASKTIKKPVRIFRKTTTTTEVPSTTTILSSTTTEIPSTTSEIPSTTSEAPSTTSKLSEEPSSSMQPLLSTVKPLQVSKTISKPSPRPRPTNWRSTNSRLTSFYNIFDISRYLPLVPNHRLRTSEVLYKDFMKPSEQMKVYSDVLQSISNEKENKDASDSRMVAVTVTVPSKDIQAPTEIPELLEATNTNLAQTKQPETILGMLPPSTQPYTTIPETTSEPLAPQSSKTVNHFYFIGMRPPKVRSKRSTNINIEEDDLLAEESETIMSYRKPQYTEIRRTRPQITPEPEAEEEDLNPRKRIYDITSTKTRTTTEPPIYEEIEDITEPTTTTTFRPKNYFVEPNRSDPKLAEYVLFIDKLHDKWAKEDATSTTTTTEATTTPKISIPQGQPEFLQIINQLHEIRQEMDAKTTTTTAEPTTNAPVTPVKNSNPFLSYSKSFMSEIQSMNDKLNPEDSIPESTNSDSSRDRNYSSRFKTNIDTSKYKTIERGPVTVRHNLSSRFNSDDNLPLIKDKTTQTPMIIAIITRNKPTEESTTVLSETTTEKELTSTIKPRTRGRTRGRPIYTSTTRATTSTVTPNPLFRRRRPITTTTTSKPDLNQTKRRITNRQKNTETFTTQIPEETTTDVVIITPVSNTEEPKKQRRFQKVQERHVMSEVTYTKYFEPSSGELESAEDTKKRQYEIVAPLRTTDTFHGGNYHHESDNHPKEFFSDPSLAQNVNQLQSSNTSSNSEETAEKVAQKPVNLSPNMASMVNLLAEKIEDNYEEETTEKPTFIKDPSRRMYYYAKL